MFVQLNEKLNSSAQKQSEFQSYPNCVPLPGDSGNRLTDAFLKAPDNNLTVGNDP